MAARLGFESLGADDLRAVVDQVIGAHPSEWTRYRQGEDKLSGFFIGHVKAATKGKADPGAAAALLRARRGGRDRPNAKKSRAWGAGRNGGRPLSRGEHPAALNPAAARPPGTGTHATAPFIQGLKRPMVCPWPVT